MIEFTGSMLQPVSGVYEIKNTHTGQCYIGQSKAILGRWATHFYQLGTGKHTLSAMQRDWNEYGPDAFKASIVKIVDDAASLLVEEAAIAREYINSGTKLYNAAIDGWTNEEELSFRLARAREVTKREEQVLQRKRAIQNEQRNQRGGNSGNPGPVRTEGGIQGRGGVFGDSPGSSVEGDQWGLRKPEAGLLVSEQGVDTEAGTKRPAPSRMDEDGQRGESDCDDTKVFPIFDSYAAEVLSDHLPKDKRDKYLQGLIDDVMYSLGEDATSMALFILAAYSPEDVAEIREMLSPNLLFFFLDEEEHAAQIEYFDNVVETYPGGLAAWVMDKVQEQEKATCQS